MGLDLGFQAGRITERQDDEWLSIHSRFRLRMRISRG